MSDYVYKLPKVGHPRSWRGKTVKSPRPFWFQVVKQSGAIEYQRKTLTWVGACYWGDALFATTPDVDCIFCLDGRLPESELDFPPTDAVWNRWERHPFMEGDRLSVCVKVMPGGSIEFDQKQATRSLRVSA